MAAHSSTVATCIQHTSGVVECDLIPQQERVLAMGPMVSDTSSDTPRALKTTALTAVEARAQDPAFVAQCSLTGLQDRLPLVWPMPPETPPSPKKSYRSYYVYLGWDDVLDSTAWEYLSDFDLILRLVDLSPLRDMLAHLLGWTSARGQTPFDPISIFLLIGWQITNHWSRAELLRQIRHPRNADYVQRFGLKDRIFPTEGGLRYWLTALGRQSTSDETVLVDEERLIEIAIQRLNHLIAQTANLIVETGFVSPEAWLQALICPDGMIHGAASRMRCSSVQDTCYQPTTPDKPRPCPAKEKDRDGCDCDTLDCASICRQAHPRDPQARSVWYAGSNQPDHSPNRSTNPDQSHQGEGELYFGYRSIPLQLADPFRRFSIVLLDDFLPANQREENPAAALLRQLPRFYPSLCVDTVAGDAGFGYDVFLHTVYTVLHARRVIDLRAHPSDKNKAEWPVRGYDDKGRPICTFGYAFTANGFDAKRQRHKWFCAQTCLNGDHPVVAVQGVTYPPDECPYTKPHHHPYGKIINVGERFDNGSLRLVRDIPVGTPTWKRLYHRARNAVEGRNADFERWHLKRLPVFGSPRGKALIFLADVWLNLSTLARLVREATAATGGF
jgi:hypothetical protein